MADARHDHLVPVGQIKVSRDPADSLTTRALGSCIGLSVYDPGARVGGLVHCMLPLSSVDDAGITEFPGMFVDTGVAALLQQVIGAGAAKARLTVRAAGAAALLTTETPFQIGERNRMVLCKVLEKNGLQLAAEDLGGHSARSMTLKIADGGTTVTKNGTQRII